MTRASLAPCLAAVVACWLGMCASTSSAQSLTLTPAGRIPGPADLVRAQGAFVYVASAKTITVFDISNPTAPKRRGSVALPEKIWGFRTSGSLLYVADGFSGLQIIDASNPDAPKLRGSLSMPGQAKNVAVSGTKAVMANHMTGVDVIDVSDLAKPRLLGSCFLDGYARDVAMSGSIAYAVDNPSGLYVIDLSTVNLEQQEPTSAIQQAIAPQKIELMGQAGATGAKLAVLVGGEPYDPNRSQQLSAGARPRGGSLQIWDLASPSSPRLATTYRTAATPRQVAIDGALAYVAEGEEGVEVVDLSQPAAPTVIATYKTGGVARDIAVTGSAVLVIVGEAGRSSASQATGDVVILRRMP